MFMKKILQIVETLDCGGIETLLVTLNESISEDYHFDYLLGVNRECFYSKRVKKLGSKILYVPSRNKGILKHMKELNYFFKNNQYDVVHYNCSSLTNIFYLYYAKKYGIKKRIIHIHSVAEPASKIHLYLHKLHKCFIKFLATDYLSCSIIASQWAFTKKIINSNRHRIINNGIDLSKFTFDENIRKIERKNLNIGDNQIVLGCVGRFVESKNQIFCLDIMKELVKYDDYYLLLIGDGPTKKQIKEIIKNFYLEKKVTILDATEDVGKYYQCMDIFVFPSLYEGLGMAVIEAQISGLSSIIFENLPKELNISNNLYRMSINSKAEEWANLIHDECKNLRNRHSIYCEEFDIRKVVKILEGVYDN